MTIDENEYETLWNRFKDDDGFIVTSIEDETVGIGIEYGESGLLFTDIVKIGIYGNVHPSDRDPATVLAEHDTKFYRIGSSPYRHETVLSEAEDHGFNTVLIFDEPTEVSGDEAIALVGMDKIYTHYLTAKTSKFKILLEPGRADPDAEHTVYLEDPIAINPLPDRPAEAYIPRDPDLEPFMSVDPLVSVEELDIPGME